MEKIIPKLQTTESILYAIDYYSNNIIRNRNNFYKQLIDNAIFIYKHNNSIYKNIFESFIRSISIGNTLLNYELKRFFIETDTVESVTTDFFVRLNDKVRIHYVFEFVELFLNNNIVWEK